MKILILSANTGQGHNAAGKAILEEAARHDIHAVMMDTFLFGGARTSRRIENIHIKSALYTPSLIGVGNRIAYKMSRTDHKTIAYHLNARYADAIHRFIENNDYDVVIATHIFAAEALTHMKRTYKSVPSTYFVVTDYAVTPFVTETELDGYFLPHPYFLPLYQKKAPGKRYIATGIPVCEEKKRTMERETARKTLSLPQNENVVMILTGSMGFGNMEGIVEALMQNAPHDTRFLAFCGTNEKLMKRLKARYKSEERLSVYGYTKQIAPYYDACDVLITKPGGLSITEAATREIPTVLMAPMPGWEEENVAFFCQKGLAESGNTPLEIATAAMELLQNRKKADTMCACQRKEMKKNAAKIIINTILKDGIS